MTTFQEISDHMMCHHECSDNYYVANFCYVYAGFVTSSYIRMCVYIILYLTSYLYI